MKVTNLHPGQWKARNGDYLTTMITIKSKKQTKKVLKNVLKI